jgi:protein-disulfide isomerase
MIALWRLLLLLGLAFPLAAQAASDPVAEVDGAPITSEEVEKALASQLSKLEEQIYNLKRQRVETLINEKLLAKEATKRGISVPALLDVEVTSKVGLVTEQEIENFYQDNKAQLKGEESNLREKIRGHLQNQKLITKRQEFLNSLRSQAKIVVHLKPPPVTRVEVSVAGAPFRGAADAPVTIVEFSEFQCPFCHRVQATLKQLLERYPGKVKLVHRDFPLDSLHPLARRASEAARCANDQRKFWEYHDAVFSHFPQASPGDLKKYAEEVGLDVAKFEGCLSGGVHKAAVQRDIDDGSRLGVTGTPAFFINGRLLSGAQPFDAFVRVIEDELARTAASPSGAR